MKFPGLASDCGSQHCSEPRARILRVIAAVIVAVQTPEIKWVFTPNQYGVTTLYMVLWIHIHTTLWLLKVGQKALVDCPKRGFASPSACHD